MSSNNTNDCITINKLVEKIAEKVEDPLYIVVYFDPYIHLTFDRMKIKPLKIECVNKYLQYIQIKDVKYISAPEYMVENIKKQMFTKLIIDVKESKTNNYSDPLSFQSTLIPGLYTDEFMLDY